MPGALLGLLLLAAPAGERAYHGEQALAVADTPAPSEPRADEAELAAPPVTPPVTPTARPEEFGLAPASQPEPGSQPRWWGPFPRPRVIGFGGPMLQLTRLDASFAAMVGLGGGAWIHERFGVGAAALWLLNPLDAGETAAGAMQRLNINYGGLTLAVVIARRKILSLVIEGLIGGGGACMQDPGTGDCFARTAMFVGQPGVGLHLRLAPILRLVLGFGYRLVKARAWSGPGELQLGGPSGAVMLEFGWF